MTQKKKNISIAIIFSILILIGIYFAIPKNNNSSQQEGDLDSLAQCIKDSGAKFYGTFWCSHCQNQKELFNNSKNLPYIECSTPDGKKQLQRCADDKITGYPTWVFADGSRLSGEISIEVLSKKTGCALSQ